MIGGNRTLEPLELGVIWTAPVASHESHASDGDNSSIESDCDVNDDPRTTGIGTQASMYSTRRCSIPFATRDTEKQADGVSSSSFQKTMCRGLSTDGRALMSNADQSRLTEASDRTSKVSEMLEVSEKPC